MRKDFPCLKKKECWTCWDNKNVGNVFASLSFTDPVFCGLYRGKQHHEGLPGNIVSNDKFA